MTCLLTGFPITWPRGSARMGSEAEASHGVRWKFRDEDARSGP